MTAPLVTIDRIGGFCPVQGCGTVQRFPCFDGAAPVPWYFRARGDGWRLSVGPTDGDDGYVPEKTAELTVWGTVDGDPYAAGWMEREQAMALIGAALELWARGERGAVVV